MNTAADTSNRKQMAGSISFTLEFSGEAIEGTYTSVGSLRSGRVSGTMRDGVCTLYDASSGAPWTGRCDPRGFNGSFRSLEGSRQEIDLNFSSTSAEVVDYDERDRVRAQQAVANAAEAKRRQEAEAARIAAMPMAGPAYSTKLASYVAEDSRGWAVNHFDAGSLHNVRVASGSLKSGVFALRGEYTFNGGSPGWVIGQFSGGKLDCIQFWDAMVGCRGIRRPGEGQGWVAALMESGSGQSAAKDGPDENTRFNMWRQQNIANGLNDNGTPK